MHRFTCLPSGNYIHEPKSKLLKWYHAASGQLRRPRPLHLHHIQAGHRVVWCAASVLDEHERGYGRMHLDQRRDRHLLFKYHGLHGFHVLARPQRERSKDHPRRLKETVTHCWYHRSPERDHPAVSNVCGTYVHNVLLDEEALRWRPWHWVRYGQESQLSTDYPLHLGQYPAVDLVEARTELVAHSRSNIHVSGHPDELYLDPTWFNGFLRPQLDQTCQHCPWTLHVLRMLHLHPPKLLLFHDHKTLCLLQCHGIYRK